MADVFVSYSRRDTAFVRGMVDDLNAHGREVWLDTAGIADAEVFPDAIRRAIESANAFVFVISPAAAASRYCEQEVSYALQLNKRVVPVLWEPVEDEKLPEGIRVRNWIPYRALSPADASARLRAALDADLQHVRSHTRWLLKALDWDVSGRDSSMLLRGGELAGAEAWLAGVGDRAEPVPTSLQREFLYASRRGVGRRQRVLVGVSLGVAAASIGLLIFALISRSQAQTARDHAVAEAHQAVSQTLGAEGLVEPQLDRALLLALEGVRIDPSSATRGDLLATILRSPRLLSVYRPVSGGVTSGGGDAVALSMDSELLAVGESSNTSWISVYSTVARKRLWQRGDGNAGAANIAFAPDGRTLAVGLDGIGRRAQGVRLYQSESGQQEQLLVPPSAVPFPTTTTCCTFPCDGCITFADHGAAVWTSYALRGRGWLVGWNLAKRGSTRVIPYPAAPPGIWTVRASKDGSLLAVAEASRRVMLINTTTGRAVAHVRLPDGFYLLALSPDGTVLAIGSSRGTVGLEDARSGRVRFMPSGHEGAVSVAAFTQRGARLVTGGADGRVLVWSTGPHLALVQTDMGHTANVDHLAVARDGSAVYSSSTDGSILAYDLDGHHGFGVPISASGKVSCGACAPTFSVTRDGSRIAAPLARGRIELLGGRNWRTTSTFRAFPQSDAVGVATISPDGRRLVSLSVGGSASLWDLTETSPRLIKHVVRSGGNGAGVTDAVAVAFTSDGRSFVLVGSGTPPDDTANFGAAEEYSSDTGAPIGSPLSTASEPVQVDIAPNGTHAVVGAFNGQVTTVSLPRFHVIRHTKVPGAVVGVAYSPDGTRIAIGDTAGQLHLFAAGTLKPAAPTFQIAAGYVTSVSFDNSGGLLAVSASDGTTQVVDVADWRTIGAPLPAGPSAWVLSTFAADDRLFTLSHDGSGTVWPLSQTALQHHACAVAHRNLTPDEWHEFLPTITPTHVCQTSG